MSKARSIGLWDFEGQFAFFEAYHRNQVNVFIHWLVIWPIFFGLVLLFYFVPMPSFGFGFKFGFGFVFASIHGVYYVSLDKKAGSLAALICFLCWVGSCSLAKHLGFSLAWKVVLAIQVVGFGAQAIGHGVFEKRSPAKDNIVQAALTAPFFVLLEVLQRLFGYEPYPGFHANVKPMIEAEVKDWEDKHLKAHRS